MHEKNTRRPRFGVLTLVILAIVALIRSWPGHGVPESVEPSPRSILPQRPYAPASTTGAPVAIPGAPAAGGTAAMEARRFELPVPTRFDLQAPTTVRPGESFEATVDLDATVGIEQLELTVTYDRTVLRLVSFSKGALVQQAGTSARFGADEPSDGNIIVSVDVNKGTTIVGTGSVAVLEFQALRSGTSPLNLHATSLVESGRPPTSTANAGREALISVE